VCDGCAKRTTTRNTDGWRTLVLNRGFLEVSDSHGSVDHVVDFHLCAECDANLDYDKVMRALVTAIQS
jgi:hypothetical protein